jgi:site-specific recombinase XerD
MPAPILNGRRFTTRRTESNDLRHTTASMLAAQGASLLEIADVLGHKTLAMVKRYSHLVVEHKAKVIEKMIVAKGL